MKSETSPSQMAVIALAFLLACALVPMAQAVPLTVGTRSPGSDGENCIPFGCSGLFGLSRYQQVYSSSAFPGPVSILSITFFDTVPDFGSVTVGTYVLSLSTTSMPVNGLDTGNLDSNVGADNQLFFSGALGGPVSMGELTLTGTMPFTYDPGDGNLLVDIVLSGLGTDGFVFMDHQQPSAPLMSRAGPPGNNNGALVTRFEVEAAQAPEPGVLALLGVGLAGLGFRRRKSVPA